MLRSPKTYRRDTIARLRSLLTASGMNATEIKAWLDEEVPQLPEPMRKPLDAKGAEYGQAQDVPLKKENRPLAVENALDNIKQPVRPGK
jgi:hypothetical protein